MNSAIQHLIQYRHLSEAEAAMPRIMNGEATDAQIAAFAVALRMKGETAEEIAGLARAMRRYAVLVHTSRTLVDTCGTGGDGRHTFNISSTSFSSHGASVSERGGRLAAFLSHVNDTPTGAELRGILKKE